uniref:Uncharacterized protein n=1 Tax=Anopheles merus TaxID=30066 RepID=A0A182US72_ANOME
MEISLMVLVPLVAILGFIYHYITKGNKYFHDKPIPSLAVEPLFGSTRRLMMKQTSFHDFVISIYNKYPLVKVFGMIDTMLPMFVVRDPELLKRIAVKDFEYFMNHRPVFGNNDDPHNEALFGKTLIAITDQKWRDMRATLSPAFTGSKMRQMFELIVECSSNMAQHYKEQIRSNGAGSREHEMKDVFTRYANDHMMEIDLTVLVPLVAILGLIYHYITKGNKYFHEKPIPSLATEPLFGSTRRLLLKKTSFTDFVISIYNKYPLVKVFGMMDTMLPMFVVRDPELIKRITVKDFDYFMNHRPVFGNNDNPHSTALFGKTLVSLNDQKWRDMRATLSPAFTGSKMRQMFELIVECSSNMAQYYKEQIRSNGAGSREHEMKDVFTRYANDVIATCAFGIKVDSLKNAENDFFVNVQANTTLSF